jgi:hypothetical protein
VRALAALRARAVAQQPAAPGLQRAQG